MTVIVGNKLVLREKTMADAWSDYTWKTDPELARLDAAPRVTAGFYQFLLDYGHELRGLNSKRGNFAIMTRDGKHIGNCGYYGVDEISSDAELGIMIGNRDYWNKGYGVDAVSTLVDYIFSNTNLNRIYLKSLDWNNRAHKCFQKCGFLPWGRMVRDGYNFVMMAISRDRWQLRQAELNASCGNGE